MSTSLIDVLDVYDTLPGAAELRARSYELLALPEGAPVIDVGCGTGRAVAELAQRGAEPIGIDLDPEMIAVAKSRWDQDFRVGDACRLPVDHVLGYRADKVLHTLEDPALAVAEARRVLDPGGRIVLVGQDWEFIVVDSADPARTRQILRQRAERLPSPYVARGYRNLLLDNGFVDVQVEVHTAVWTEDRMLPGITRLADDEEWIAEQTERARTGRFFAAIPLFVASGTADVR